MPRQRPSAGRSAPTRPTLPSKPAAPSAQQTRPAATMAAPPAAAPSAAPPMAAPSQGPGMLGQIASTAAGVAIGSTIGNAVSGLFGGSSAPEPQQNQVQATQAQTSSGQEYAANNCAPALQQFTKCMDDQQGNMQICNWYLEQLKACQAAAAQY